MRYCQACQRCFGDRVEFCLIDQSPTRLVGSLPLVIDQKYRLERLIAHGGMGSVYRANHISLDRPVAVKILRPEYLEDTTIRERFRREAKAIARLKHPNVVSIYDYGLLPGEEPDQCGAYLVMELVEGQSLRHQVRGGAFSVGSQGLARAASVITQICAGVDAAHSHGIIHRDLKPDNIMIEESANGFDRVLVLDFGIAKLKDREHIWQGLTDEDTIIGTPNYLSPEQCSGQEIDHRSDVYSLGIMLYEMLTSTTPFASPNTSATLLRHLQEKPPPIARFRPDLGSGIERIVMRALEKNPDLRFASAAELATVFNQAVALHLRSMENEVTLGEPAPLESGNMGPYPVTEPLPHSSDDFSGETIFRPFRKISEPTRADDHELFTTSAALVREDRRSRLVSFAIFSAIFAMILSGIYFWAQDWRAWAVGGGQMSDVIADKSGPLDEKIPVQKSIPASNPVGVVHEAAAWVPVRPVNSEMTERSVNVSDAGNVSDHTARELRSVYNTWVNSAIRGDWKRHIGLYGSRVEYFRDGYLSRSKVEARKRKIFKGVDSFDLKFSESPSVRLRSSRTTQLADLTFQRRWTLRRGKKRVMGRARGMLTLRRDPAGWRIISEKQIGK